MNIFKIEFKSTFKSLLIWSGIIAVIIVLFMALYPSMNTEAMKELVHVKLNALPAEMLQALGIADIPDFTDIIEFYGYIFQYIMLAAAVYAVLLGAAALSKEESDGTIEFLYAQPIKRSHIVWQKLLSTVCSFLVFNIFTAVVSIVLCLLLKPADADSVDLVISLKTIISGMVLSGLVFIAIGFFISTIIKSSKQAAPIGVGLVFGTYILGILSRTFSDKIETAKYLKYFSPIDYALPLELIKKGFDATSVVIALVIIAVCVALALMIYQRKDFRV